MYRVQSYKTLLVLGLGLGPALAKKPLSSAYQTKPIVSGQLGFPEVRSAAGRILLFDQYLIRIVQLESDVELIRCSDGIDNLRKSLA